MQRMRQVLIVSLLTSQASSKLTDRHQLQVKLLLHNNQQAQQLAASSPAEAKSPEFHLLHDILQLLPS